jgi:hypothetical protein
LAAVGITAGFIIGFVCGSIVGGVQSQRDYWKRDCKLVQPVLDREPAYANVQIASYHDDGWLILEGEVPTEHDKWRLMQDVIKAIGTEKAENAVPGVRIKNP